MNEKPAADADESVPAAARGVIEQAEVIEQAKGALMLVYSVDADHAVAVLRAASLQADLELREVAAAVVAALPAVGAPENTGALRECLGRVLFGPRRHSW